MIQKKIADIDNDMSILRRCNNILFTHWKDGNADNFNTAIVQGIENQYLSFSQEVNGASAELKSLQKELEQSSLDIQKTAREIENLCQNPSIQGCHACQVFGSGVNDFTEERRYFVLGKNESQFINSPEYLMSVAHQRCTGLQNIKKVTVASNL